MSEQPDTLAGDSLEFPREAVAGPGRKRLTDTVRRHMRASWAALLVAAICLVGTIVTELLAPWPIKIIFDHVLLGTPLTAALAPLAPLFASGPWVAIGSLSAAILVLVLVGGGFSYAQLHLSATIGHRLTDTLRRELFARLQRAPLAFHQGSRSGELMLKFASDTAVIKELFSDWALTIASHVLLITGMLVVMFVVNWRLALVVLVSLPVLMLILRVLNRSIRRSVIRQRRQEGTMLARLGEMLGAIATVKAFGRGAHEEQRFAAHSADNLDDAVRTSRQTAAVAKSIALVFALATASTLMVGSGQVLAGAMSPGDLLVFMAYLRSVYKPIRDLGKLSVKLSRTMVSVGRVAELYAIEVETEEAGPRRRASGLAGAIEFRKVSFAHADGRPVLDEVTFHIRAGERVAIVGSSGSGKSTIVNLVLRLFEPGSGTILVDGHNIREYAREELRQEIGVVLQDTILFGCSVRENIAYGKPDATQAEIEEAAREAHAHEFIEALPDGYATILSERGASLSGGQRQRVCLARAFLKRPSILILDEPTAAVDPLSATLVSEAVSRVQQGRTTLVIAHQFPAMIQFDQILVLERGRIVERGPHARLMDRKGRYYALQQGAAA